MQNCHIFQRYKLVTAPPEVPGLGDPAALAQIMTGKVRGVGINVGRIKILRKTPYFMSYIDGLSPDINLMAKIV